MTRRAVLVAMMVAAAALAGCKEQVRWDPKTRSITYVTRAGDTPYTIAHRAYGEAWMGFQIAQANKDRLLKEGGFKPGTQIVIPPDLKGNAVDPRRFDHGY